jgi:hypothetical protein
MWFYNLKLAKENLQPSQILSRVNESSLYLAILLLMQAGVTMVHTYEWNVEDFHVKIPALQYSDKYSP